MAKPAEVRLILKELRTNWESEDGCLDWEYIHDAFDEVCDYYEGQLERFWKDLNE